LLLFLSLVSLAQAALASGFALPGHVHLAFCYSSSNVDKVLARHHWDLDYLAADDPG
jgi:hypothetical protein